MSVAADVFKRVMRRWASGVAIVTTCNGDEIHGLTVSGFVGVSPDPALVVISIGHNQHSHDKFHRGGVYAVSLLHAGQAEWSDRFAGRPTEAVNRFEGVAHKTAVTGEPILDDCLAWFDCRIVAEHVAGDHTLFIGEVLAAEVVRDAPPLVFHNTAYPRLEWPPAQGAAAKGSRRKTRSAKPGGQK